MIYTISDGDRIKIGYAKNPSTRLKQLQTGSSKTLKLLKIWEGDRLDEKRIHYILRWQRSRIKGEWFNLREGDLDVIDQILA